MASSAVIRPSVIVNFLDETIRPNTVPTSTGALVFASNRGPLTPQYTTDKAQFIARYGNNAPDVSYGWDTAFAFFKEGTAAWTLRIAGQGALYSTAVIANDKLPDGSYEKTSITRGDGSSLDYTAYNRAIYDLTISASLASGQSVTVTINGTPTSTVNFTNTHNNTMRLIAQAVQTVIDGLGLYGTATVVPRLDPLADYSTIRIISPETVTSLTISTNVSGTGAPTMTASPTEWLYCVITENPGQWGENIALQIPYINSGVNAITRLRFSGAIASGQSVLMRINDTVIGPVTFTTDNNTTLQAVATAISTALAGTLTAAVTQVSGSNANREILLTGVNAFKVINVQELSVTGSGTPPTITWAKIVGNQWPQDQFRLVVYEGADLRNSVEGWTGTLQESQSAMDNSQTSLDYQVNLGPTKSDRIRLIPNPAMGSEWLVNSTTTPDYPSRTGYLRGGSDGALVTTNQIVNGWELLKDTSNFSLRLLMNAGYSTVEVHKQIVDVCESRHDCIGLLDAPAAYQDAAALVNYRKNMLGIDSSYVGLFTPNLLIYDPDTGKRRYTVPSGFVAQRHAYTDRVRKEWFAAAGLNRGIISEALDLLKRYSDGEQDLLQAAQINPIIDKNGRKVIWGEMSMQYAASDLQSLPIRRLCNLIEIEATDSVSYSLYEPNDQFTRNEVKRKIDDIMQEIKYGRGIRRWETIADDRNNPPSTVNARELNCTVFFETNPPVLRIYITGVLTRAGASFSELIQQGVGFPAVSNVSTI